MFCYAWKIKKKIIYLDNTTTKKELISTIIFLLGF